MAEVLSTLSLATDVGNGAPLEKSLRGAIIATRLAAELGLAAGELADVYHTALLGAIGCTAHAHENAALLGDDLEFEEPSSLGS